MVSYDKIQSSLGTLYLIFSGHFLTGIDFKKPSEVPFKKGIVPEDLKEELTAYLDGSVVKFHQETKFLTGTEFERKVWTELTEIPFGETRSYKWVAEKVGSPGAARAVGQALGKNPIPIIYPCHRVIESDGSLGGFSGGLDIKVRLLEIEYYAKMNESHVKAGDKGKRDRGTK